MRFFTLIDFRHLVLALSLGAVAALAIYLAFRFPSAPGEEKDSPVQKPDFADDGYPDQFTVADNPVPPVLVLVILGFLVWFILYVIFFGLLGRPL